LNLLIRSPLSYSLFWISTSLSLLASLIFEDRWDPAWLKLLTDLVAIISKAIFQNFQIQIIIRFQNDTWAWT
jgi:hypothetical protein